MKPDELMEHEVEEIKKSFKYFDKTNTNTIKTEDLGNALRWLKLVPSNLEIAEYSKLADPTDSGKIKWEYFLNVVCKYWISDLQQREALLWQAFLHFDKQDKGKMSVAEMRSILLEVGTEPLLEKEVNAIIKDAVDKDDMIEYGYLIRLWQK